MYKVIGVKHQTGNYKGHPFDNYYLFVDDPEYKYANVQKYGNCPELIKKSYGVKIKAGVLHQVVSPDKIEKLIGRNVDFFFDARDNVSKVEVI